MNIQLTPEQQYDFARRYAVQMARNREHQRAYYQRKKEEIKEYQRQHYQANRVRILERVKNYQQRAEAVEAVAAVAAVPGAS